MAASAIAILVALISSVGLASAWAAARPRNPVAVGSTGAVLIYCAVVLAYGVLWHAQDQGFHSRPTAVLEPISRFILWFFPASLCVCAAQFLLKRASRSRAVVVGISVVLGLSAIVALPFVGSVVSCGLLGTCKAGWVVNGL